MLDILLVLLVGGSVAGIAAACTRLQGEVLAAAVVPLCVVLLLGLWGVGYRARRRFWS